MEERHGIGPVDSSASVNSEDTQLCEMLRTVLRSLVDEPNAIQLQPLSTADGVVFQVRCAASDLGKLIGKSGRTARALRTILSGNSVITGRKYSLDLGQHELAWNDRPSANP